MNLESYYIFYVVAKEKSITKAAANLYISQPAVTFQIKKLEQELGLPLFIRTKKGTILTKEGETFFKYVKTAIESLENGLSTLTNLKELDSGIIRIGASTTVSKYVLMPSLAKFHETYPNIEIKIENNLTENLLTDLRNGNLDLLLLNMPMEKHQDIKITKVMDVEDIFVGNKKYYELTKGHVNLKDLNNYPLLFQKSPSNTREYLNNYLKNNHINLIPKMEVVSYNLIMEFVKNGFGISYATKEFIKDELERKELYEIKVTPKVPKRYIGIITLNNTIPNYSVRKLLEMMLEKKEWLFSFLINYTIWAPTLF